MVLSSIPLLSSEFNMRLPWVRGHKFIKHTGPTLEPGRGGAILRRSLNTSYQLNGQRLLVTVIDNLLIGLIGRIGRIG